MAANFDDSGSGRISRRSFIERTSLLAAGTAVAGTLIVPKAVHANTSDEIKVALVGSGNRGAGAAAQALHTGERTVMFHRGRIVFDAAGPERDALEVGDLMELFKREQGEELADDSLLLG